MTCKMAPAIYLFYSYFLSVIFYFYLGVYKLI